MHVRWRIYCCFKWINEWICERIGVLFQLEWNLFGYALWSEIMYVQVLTCGFGISCYYFMHWLNKYRKGKEKHKLHDDLCECCWVWRWVVRCVVKCLNCKGTLNFICLFSCCTGRTIWKEMEICVLLSTILFGSQWVEWDDIDI